DGLVDAGTHGISAHKHGRAPWRAFRHGPCIAKAYAGMRHGVDIGQDGPHVAAIAEDLHLVYAYVVHDHEQDIGPLSGIVAAPASSATIAPDKDKRGQA